MREKDSRKRGSRSLQLPTQTEKTGCDEVCPRFEGHGDSNFEGHIRDSERSRQSVCPENL